MTTQKNAAIHSTSDLGAIQHEGERHWLEDHVARRFICGSEYCGGKLAQVHPIRDDGEVFIILHRPDGNVLLASVIFLMVWMTGS
jgi:hypothetical protein